MNWVANVKTESSSAAEMSVMIPAVPSPLRAAERRGPLTMTAAAAILTMFGGVNSTSRPSGLLMRGQLMSAMSAAPKTSAAASEPV